MENENPKRGGDGGVCEGAKEEWSSSKTSRREDPLRSTDLSVNVQGFGASPQSSALVRALV